MTEEESDKSVDAGESVRFQDSEQAELMEISINGESFLLPVGDVAEVIRPVEITPVPMAPDHMLGVVNIRGQIVCIVDPGKVLHLKQERSEQMESSRYLILRHPRMHLGIWVDEVSELYRVAADSLPEVDSNHSGHLCGEVDVGGGRVFNLLNTQILFD